MEPNFHLDLILTYC